LARVVGRFRAAVVAPRAAATPDEAALFALIEAT
jgi:hypothetical protein